MFEPEAVRDLTPQEVAAGLAAGSILLVDVREPNETAVERIPGAVLVPLSRFDLDDIPDPQGRPWCSPVRSEFARCVRQKPRSRLDTPMMLTWRAD